MRTRPRRTGAAVVAALGLGGLVLAHVLEYLALAPDAHHRAYVLAATGHQYLPSAVSGAAFLAVAAVAAVFLSGLRVGVGAGPGRRRLGDETAGGTDWARLLPIAQAVAFVVVEVAERLVAGASLSDLGPVLVLGIPLQVLAGIAGGRLLSALDHAGERLGRVLAGATRLVGGTRRRAVPGWRPAAESHPSSLLPGGPTPARGPPPLLVSA